ncbi:unnamed protein product [Rotaria sordida]|uniref:LIM zinc-binding domain-containing protein n=1 Tax=Rotaria sordida TaxID=392033 RepID=A0A819GPY7_9BILA|nr:unnamed protein product [Rotaria sordida]CAF3886152.1 unnamed protein product [Rotaria sordida]
MSSSPLSSKEIFTQNQEERSDRPKLILTPIMNFDHHSPGQLSSSTTRIIVPRPFYRSQMTPDPFDYSNNNRQLSDHQQYLQNRLQRRFSTNQINDSSLSNSYLSEQERSSPTISMHPNSYKPYRSIPNNNRALISVSSTKSPLITIASGGLPSRSEIRVSSSPTTNKSTLREIRISRPDSPSISINRTGTNQPITFTNNSNDGMITNGSGGAFHISVEPPTNTIQHDRQRQTSPSFHQIETRRDSGDNPYKSNIVANRFKSSIAYTSPNNNTFDRPSTISANLPPISLPIHHEHLIKKEQSEVDHLTSLLMKSMNSSNQPNFFGMCARCNDEIVGEENGLIAMDRMYHVPCFTCTMCGCRLRGMHFYSMENKPYCESCYVNSLEKCVACALPITDRILRATGKPYHAQCFSCMTCQKSLDGIPFTVDATMQIHCIDCFHEKFAPRCYVCHRPILPQPGQEETIRIIAFDRSYHIDCYRCENCNIQFTTEEGCYPIDDHVLCLQCNRKYSTTMFGHS